MNYCRQFRDEELDRSLSRPDINLLFGTGGALSGVMYCNEMEYGPFGVHDDQEGFFVLSGTGTFYVDGEEFRVGPEMAIMIPPHVEHCFKKDADSEDMKIFYFHAAN